MLRFLLFACLVWMSAVRAVAQDWATVRARDTTWFMGGVPGVILYTNCNWNGGQNQLRVAFVDSVRAIGADSVFHFPRGLRGTNPQGTCIDSAAATWLGYRMIRTGTGIEKYFNSVADTITLLPQAQVGESWMLAKDTFGRSFRATITAAGIATIDGATDSVKTAAIQAYTGNTPVAHLYNTRVLEWSKAHGWVRPLDFFLFPQLPPYTITGNPQPNNLGSQYDSAQMHRVSTRAIQLETRRISLATKYTPGNEWITTTTIQPYGEYSTTTHDSVIAFQPVDSLHGLATVSTVSVYRQTLPYVNVTLSRSTHTTQVSAVLAFEDTFRLPLLPEVRTSILNPTPSSPAQFIRRYEIKPVCGGYLISNNRFSSSLSFSNGCWNFLSPMDPPFSTCRTLLTGFGIVQSVTQGPSVPGGFPRSQHERIAYLRLNGCTWGAKIDVAALGTNDLLGTSANIPTIAPNPATAIARLSNLPSGETTITLREATGRILQTFKTNGPTAEIPTASRPTGVYLVEVSNSTGRATLRLQVLH